MLLCFFLTYETYEKKKKKKNTKNDVFAIKLIVDNSPPTGDVRQFNLRSA